MSEKIPAQEVDTPNPVERARQMIDNWGVGVRIATPGFTFSRVAENTGDNMTFTCEGYDADGNAVTLQFDDEELVAFMAGVLDGQFDTVIEKGIESE